MRGDRIRGLTDARVVAFPTLTGIGVVVMALSAVTPWASAQGGDDHWELSPTHTDVLRPATWLLLAVALAGGALHLSRSRRFAAAGGVAAIWLTFSLPIWLGGVKLGALMPSEALPDKAMISLEYGLILSILGSGLVLIACVGELLCATWTNNASPSVPLPRLVLATALIALLLVSYTYGWLTIDASVTQWNVGADAIPFLGDVVGAAVGVAIVLVAATVLRQYRIVSMLMMGAGLVVVFAAAATLSMGAVLERATEALTQQFEVVRTSDAGVRLGPGPWLALTAGAATMGFGLLTLGRRVPTAEPTALTQNQVAGPDERPSW